MIKVIRMVSVYVYQREERDIISEARNEEHIIDQWTTLRNRVPYLHERTQKFAFRLIMRAAAAPNAQTGCERTLIITSPKRSYRPP